MSVFKAYDIRGLSPEEIDASFAERLGIAVAGQFHPKRVLVGRDMRVTSPDLEDALIRGLTQSGVDVVRIGLCSTPMFNVTLGLARVESRKSKVESPFDLGVMVTASHNPGKYNGFKLTGGDVLPIGQGYGMEELEKTFGEILATPDIIPTLRRDSQLPTHVGSVTDDPMALHRYVEHILDLAKMPVDMSEMKIAIDAGNGMAGFVLPRLIEKLPWLKVEQLYFTPDGSFPNHEANPLKRETLDDLKEKVRSGQCAVGVAFDGDADRVGFVDETGEQIPGDLLTALLAQEVLLDHPDGLVLYDVRSSWSVPEAVEEAGGHTEMCRVGHALIKRLMSEKAASFAGELSMHFYFKELWNCESGDLAMLLLLRMMHREQKPLSALWKPLKRYAKSDETNFSVTDQKAAMDRIESAFIKDATNVIRIDGLRLEFTYPNDERKNWWFSVRASNTEPLLRLVVEAVTPDILNEKMAELTSLIG